MSLLLFISAYLYALFLYDYNFLTQFADSKGFLPLEMVKETLFELFLFIAILISALYYLYRQTDWIGVKNKTVLILSSVALVIFLGNLLYSVSGDKKDNIFQERQHNLESGIHKDRLKRLSKAKESKNIFIGNVEKINIKDHSVTLENHNSKKVFYVTNISKLEYSQTGDTVMIKYYKKDGKLWVDRIKKVSIGEVKYINR